MNPYKMAEARQQINTKDQGQKSMRTECINSSIRPTADVPIAFYEFKEKTVIIGIFKNKAQPFCSQNINFGEQRINVN